MKNKVIREKYICQLYGTTVMYSLNRPKEFSKYKIIRGVFVSTVPYTPEAKKFSDYLKIEYLVIPLDNYPMIKCNINMRTGEKIYHLPFDQQYDKCVIKKELGTNSQLFYFASFKSLRLMGLFFILFNCFRPLFDDLKHDFQFCNQ